MRVAHVILRYRPAVGGGEVHAREIARAQARAGAEVHVVTTRVLSEVPFAAAPALPAVEDDDGVRVHRLATTPLVRGLWGYGTRMRGLASTMASLEPHVVHAHGYGSEHADRLARWRPRHPWKLAVKFYGFVPGRGALRPVKTLYDRTVGRRTLRRVDLAVAVAPGDGEALRQAGCRRVALIPNGVDSERFRALPDRRAARARLGLDGPTLLSVGRLAELKGQDRTLRALALLRRRWPGASALFVGADAGFGRRLRSIASGLDLAGSVRFAGQVSDRHLLDAYAAADVLVHPARDEAFGLVLLEAMSSGLPVVASGAGGIPFVVGDAGAITDGEPEPIAQAVARIFQSQAYRAELASRGRARAKVFCWGASAGRLLDLYEDMACASS